MIKEVMDSFYMNNYSCIFKELTLVLTCPRNINTLFMACKELRLWFRVNNNTLKLVTTLGMLTFLPPAIQLIISQVIGHNAWNCLYADVQEKLDRLLSLRRQSLFLQIVFISLIMVFCIVFDISVFTVSISMRWFTAVLYCFIQIALQASLLWPRNTVFLFVVL